MNQALATAARWMVSTRADGEVLTAGVGSDDLEFTAVGFPDRFTPEETAGWLNDLTGVSRETSLGDATARSIPPLLHHALTGLLFSHAELWETDGISRPCSAAFVCSGDQVAFGWVGEALPEVWVDEGPLEHAYTRVRDDEGREALGVSFERARRVRVRLTWTALPGATDAPSAVIEAEWAGAARPEAEARAVDGAAKAAGHAARGRDSAEAPVAPSRPMPVGPAMAAAAEPAAGERMVEEAVAAIELPGGTRGRHGLLSRMTSWFRREKPEAPLPESAPAGPGPVHRTMSAPPPEPAPDPVEEPPVADASVPAVEAAPEPEPAPAAADVVPAMPTAAWGEELYPQTPAPPALALGRDPNADPHERVLTSGGEPVAPPVLRVPSPTEPPPVAPPVMRIPRLGDPRPAPVTESMPSAATERVERTPAAEDAPPPPLISPAPPAPAPAPPALVSPPLAPPPPLPAPPAWEPPASIIVEPDATSSEEAALAAALEALAAEPVPAAAVEPPVPPPPPPAAPDVEELRARAAVGTLRAALAARAAAKAAAEAMPRAIADLGVELPPAPEASAPGSATVAPSPAPEVAPPAPIAVTAPLETPPVEVDASRPDAVAEPPRSSVPTDPPIERVPMRPDWPTEAEMAGPAPLWKRWWAWAVVVMALFAGGWLVGSQQHDRDRAPRPGPLTALVRGLGIGGARFDVMVNSRPPGAWIAVDGKDLARRTPATIDLAPGEHKVTLSISELGGATFPVRGQRGDQLALDAPLWGTLDVYAADGAPPVTVTFDGHDVGFAPVHLDSVLPGAHDLRFSGPGMPAWGQPVEVRVAQKAEVVARPMVSPATGVIEVRARITDDQGTRPLSGAQVWVDGEPKGSTPLSLELPRGPHSVRVAYREATAPVQVIDLPGGNQRFADFELGAGIDRPRLAALDPNPRFVIDRGGVMSATLDGVDVIDAREMWLHVRTPEGAWRRYPMSMLKSPTGVTGVTVFPANLFEPGAHARCYVSAMVSTGDEYFTELMSAEIVAAGAPARPAR